MVDRHQFMAKQSRALLRTQPALAGMLLTRLVPKPAGAAGPTNTCTEPSSLVFSPGVSEPEDQAGQKVRFTESRSREYVDSRSLRVCSRATPTSGADR
jgi:hypothetical protein